LRRRRGSCPPRPARPARPHVGRGVGAGQVAHEVGDHLARVAGHVHQRVHADRAVALEHDLDRLAEQAVELELAEPAQALLHVDALDALALVVLGPEQALDRHRAVLERLQLALGVDDRRERGGVARLLVRSVDRLLGLVLYGFLVRRRAPAAQA
jgi:hypothetical protein